MYGQKDRKYKSLGIIATILFHTAVLFILYFCVITTIPEEEEGLLVNFGTSDNGQGQVEPASSTSQPEPTQPEPQQAPAPAEPLTTPQNIEADGQSKDTQDFEEAAALEEAKRKAEAEAKAKREKAEAEAKRIAEQKRAEAEAKAKAEAEAKAKAETEAKAKAEAEARAKAEAEEKARKDAQAAAARSNVLKGLSGAGTGTSASQGTGSGSGNQGSLTGGASNGSGNSSRGNGFSLAGRQLVGTLPKPTYNIQEEGTVIVTIIVDKYGNVKSTDIQMQGTTIQNRTLWKYAKEAAMKAKFNSDPSAAAAQKGTITYRFHLE